MATNQYFSRGSKSEQRLYEDLVIESLKMYGQDVYYVPREIVRRDTVFNEATLSRFVNAYRIEMYLENTDGFDGEGDLFTKFGIQIRDTANFVVSRRRFNWEIGSVENGGNPNTFYRPREGDVIHLPLSNSTFQIMKVEDETPFYQLKNLPTFRLSCELFEYSDENFDTEIASIDNIETYAAYQYVLTIRTAEQARATATASID